MAFTRSTITGNRSFSPFILWDATAGKFRCWYNGGEDGAVKTFHRDSPDAITWSAPTEIVRPINSYGCTVVDEGTPGPLRFKTAYWNSAQGVVCAGSPDGIAWTVVGTPPAFSPANVSDILDLWKNPLNGWYQLFLKPMPAIPRRTHLAWTINFTSTPAPSSWSTPIPSFLADAHPLDKIPDASGNGTQFYGAAGPIQQNGLLVFFVRVLRDDIRSGSASNSSNYAIRGTGHTVLAWSRDGFQMSRQRKPFFAGRPGTFDEAISWVYGAAVKDDVLYLSYTAYDLGHKAGQTGTNTPGNRVAALATLPMSEFPNIADLGYQE